MLNEQFYEEQRKKFIERVQKAIEEDFARTHDLIMANIVPTETITDKGTLRNINNHRMKFWSESYLLHRSKGEYIELSNCSLLADLDLAEFDKRFKQ